MKDNDTFCTLPFLQFSTDPSGYYQACCIAKKTDMNMIDTAPLDFFNSTHMKSLRYDMANNINSDLFKQTCHKCILNEKKTGFSKRLINKHDPKSIDPIDLQAIRDNKDYNLTPKRVDSFKIKIFGNLCNLKCTMCYAGASSKIAAEYKKLGLYTGDSIINPFNKMDQKRFFEDLKTLLPITKSIELVGGEPFLYPETVPFIKWIVDNNLSKNLILRFITNGTVEDIELYSYFSEFKQVRVLVSIDNVYDKEEYIRTGTVWNDKVQIIKNLITIPNTIVGFSNTLQMLNMGYLSDIYDFTLKEFNKHAPLNNQLTYPASLRSSNLPRDIVDMYLDKYKNKRFTFKKGHIKALELTKTEANHNNFLKGISHYKYLDKKRNTNLIDHFPEFKKYYDKV